MFFTFDIIHLNKLLEDYNGSLLFELKTNFTLDDNGNKKQNLNLSAEEECLISGENKENLTKNVTEIFSQRTSETDTLNNDRNKTPENNF